MSYVNKRPIIKSLTLEIIENNKKKTTLFSDLSTVQVTLLQFVIDLYFIFLFQLFYALNTDL